MSKLSRKLGFSPIQLGVAIPWSPQNSLWMMEVDWLLSHFSSHLCPCTYHSTYQHSCSTHASKNLISQPNYWRAAGSDQIGAMKRSILKQTTELMNKVHLFVSFSVCLRNSLANSCFLRHYKRIKTTSSTCPIRARKCLLGKEEKI